MAEFHANPMPGFQLEKSGVPMKEPPCPTKVKPFNLEIDKRGNARQEMIKEEVNDCNIFSINLSPCLVVCVFKRKSLLLPYIISSI